MKPATDSSSNGRSGVSSGPLHGARAVAFLRAHGVGRDPIAARQRRDRVWERGARVGASLLARCLSHDLPGTTAYLQGSLACGDGRFGVSDIDLNLVIADHPNRPGANRARLLKRWRTLKRRIPLLAHAVDLMAWEQAEFDRAVLSRSSWRPNGQRSLLQMSVCVRPGLYGPSRHWMLLHGPERRPLGTARDPSDLWLDAWAELQFWCRQAFVIAADPASELAGFFALKLVAEPMRIWLWVVHGIRLDSRSEVLERGAALLPAEAETLRWAATLPRHIPRAERERVVESALRAFFRLSERLAARLASEEDAVGTITVRLEGARGGNGRLPLVDRVALTCPNEVEEWCVREDVDPRDPHALGAMAVVDGPRVYPLLRTERLLVLPALDIERTKLRALQSAVTDPVTCALVSGHDVAHFAQVPGFSASDYARRAVVEHAARLGLNATRRRPMTPAGVRNTSRWLLNGARVALFLESIEQGRPTLAVTLEALTEQLSAVSVHAGELAAEAVAAVRADPIAPLPNALEFRRIVAQLAPFSSRTGHSS